MGYLPKSIKVRRHRWNMRIIATAALSGCTFVLVTQVVAREQDALGHRVTEVTEDRWAIEYPDGKISHSFKSKSTAASTYLLWWFNVHGMFPRYK